MFSVCGVLDLHSDVIMHYLCSFIAICRTVISNICICKVAISIWAISISCEINIIIFLLVRTMIFELAVKGAPESSSQF